jgi:O-antigen ligase
MALFDRRRLGAPISGGFLVVLFLLVPLVVSPGLTDPFTSVKCHLLAAIAASWLVAERFLCSSRGLPRVVIRAWPAWAAIAGSVCIGSLRHGADWAVRPLNARAAFVALALASFWHFRRTRLRVGPLRAATLAAAAIAVGLGLAQFAGLDLLPWLAGGDNRSATFGNVNMAAQFVGLALVVLLAAPPQEPGSVRRLATGIATEVFAGAALAYLWLAGARSVGLAFGAAVVVLWRAGRITAPLLLRMGAAAAVLAGFVLGIAPTPTGPLHPSVRTSKRASAEWRLAVWSDTIGLIREHPAGVGAGNFEQAFIPYALAGRSKPGDATVFRSPHNEYLRLVAEEGIAGALLLLALLVVLARELHRSPAIARWRSEPGVLIASSSAFLLVEAFFQFPFELAFPSLLSAVLLGLALACTEAPTDPASTSLSGPSRPGLRRLGDAASMLLALGIGVGLVRVAVAEGLVASSGGDVAALERACALDPRRLEACVEAAWLRSRAGEHATARQALRSVLERSPSYFPAIKLLGEDLLSVGDRAAGCRHLRRYDEMFGGHSSAHERVRESCPRETPWRPPSPPGASDPERAEPRRQRM